MEEQVRGFGFEGQVADFVDDDQPVTAQPGQFLRQAALPVGVGQAGDPFGGGGEQNPLALMGGDDAQRGGQMRLPGAGRPEKNHVAGLEEERP